MNTSPTAQHVVLYADSASLGAGQFSFGTTPNELTSWISFQRSSLDLSPDSNATVMTTIQVPARASQGERYAVIWAEVSAPPGAQGNIGVVNRVGVRVYLDVGPGGDPPSDFQIENLAAARAANGQPQVLAQVRNTGKRALDMSGSLTLTNGPASTSAGPFPATDGTTLGPGDSAPVTAALDRQLSNGPWTATFTLYGGLVQHTANATLTFPVAPGTTSPVRVSLDRSAGSALNWPTILEVAGLILLSVAIWLLFDLKRRRAAPG
ncbi:peptidase [Streptacidiphilus sp. EB129]|uniref:peptidase n=1 Tax=Streptacidiphilus sp. EB129 TaxID=3156262 RepID=UPI0035147FE6